MCRACLNHSGSNFSLVSTMFPGEKQAGISTEDRERTFAKDRVPGREHDTCEGSETGVSGVDDCICTTVDLSPRIETATKEEYSTEEIGSMQEAAPRMDSANKVEDMEGRQVLECDSFTLDKGDFAHS